MLSKAVHSLLFLGDVNDTIILLNGSNDVDAPESHDTVVYADGARANLLKALSQFKVSSVRLDVARLDTHPILDLILTRYAANLDGNHDVAMSLREQFNEAEPCASSGFNCDLPHRNRDLARDRLPSDVVPTSNRRSGRDSVYVTKHHLGRYWHEEPAASPGTLC